MATPEGRVKAKVDALFKRLGVWFYSPQAGPYGVSGIPDRVAIVRGTFLGVECKADAGKTLTKLQERTRDKILAAGGSYVVVCDDASLEELRLAIVRLSNRE